MTVIFPLDMAQFRSLNGEVYCMQCFGKVTVLK